VNHRDVLLDPIFHDLVRRHELAARRLRESVLALRAWHLDHVKHPGEETAGEKWRSASLQNAAHHALDVLRDAAADLVRYGFELAPYSNDDEHRAEIAASREAHRERVEKKTGWGKGLIQFRGPEEKVRVDDGPPITIVLKEAAAPDQKSRPITGNSKGDISPTGERDAASQD
jgi:hypothetical protein